MSYGVTRHHSYHPHHCVYATWGTLEGWVKSFESNAGAPTTAGVGFQQSLREWAITLIVNSNHGPNNSTTLQSTGTAIRATTTINHRQDDRHYLWGLANTRLDLPSPI